MDYDNGLNFNCFGNLIFDGNLLKLECLLILLNRHTKLISFSPLSWQLPTAIDR